jgi:hypothetical protein
MVQDTQGDPTIQRRILAVGSSNNDGEMLASLEALPGLVPDVDTAIGKRPGAKERSAWISRADRTTQEVHTAIQKEKRVAVLQAAAKRRDLSEEDYALMAKHKLGKVDVALLLNPSVSIELKKVLAAHWGSCADEDGYRMSEDLNRIFGPIPSVHDALGSRTTNRSILRFVAKSKLSEGTQLRVVEHLVKPCVHWIAKKRDDYSAIRDFEEAVTTAIALAGNPFVTSTVRETVTAAFMAVGVIPNATRSYYNSSDLEAERQKVLAALRAGATGSYVDPAEEAVATSDLVRLLELAKLASSKRNSTLAQAILANDNVNGEIVREVAEFVSWQNRGALYEMLIRRDDTSAFVEVAVNTWGIPDDDVLAKAKAPSDVLKQLASAAVGASNGRNSYTWLQILQSKWCTPEVILELPTLAIGHPEAPAHLGPIVNSALLSAFGENDEKWGLFEALIGDGSMPLREVIAAVEALSS